MKSTIYFLLKLSLGALIILLSYQCSEDDDPKYEPIPVKAEIKYLDDNTISFTIDETLKDAFGFQYPLSMIIELDQDLASVQKRAGSNNEWLNITQVQETEIAKGIECYRIIGTNRAVVSFRFEFQSNSISLKFIDGSGNAIKAEIIELCEYYDNKKCAVTVTADDWSTEFNESFIKSCRIFRDKNIWLTVGIIVDYCDDQTVFDIQSQLDSGLIEAASHSLTHPFTNVDYYYKEVTHSKIKIIDMLDLPVEFKAGDKEFVYTWIAPYGDITASANNWISESNYIVSRLYYGGTIDYATLHKKNYFANVGVSTEMGSMWLGTDDIADLNATFDRTYASEGVYHTMFHPNVIRIDSAWNEDYFAGHINYISNREDIWYVSFGHLYLYRFMYEKFSEALVQAGKD